MSANIFCGRWRVVAGSFAGMFAFFFGRDVHSRFTLLNDNISRPLVGNSIVVTGIWESDGMLRLGGSYQGIHFNWRLHILCRVCPTSSLRLYFSWYLACVDVGLTCDVQGGEVGGGACCFCVPPMQPFPTRQSLQVTNCFSHVGGFVRWCVLIRGRRI